jgi:adenine-specific DNA-methyltransferase
MAKKKTSPTPIETIRHKDKRTNIPTEELKGFVTEEEQQPKAILYPRDPSLDPQLVWKGKDEQDQADLAVPAVPIYIQEKIHPQALIDALPRIEREADKQLNFFADFNGGPKEFAEKVDFYHHEQNWTNRLILGDSLLVMTSLAEKEGLKGKVQTIYLDPPYGIKFGSNWQVSTRKRDVKDGKVEDATRQPEQVRAFRDTWQLGIHSYLAYLRDRLTVARELLTETGSIFVQIGDENVHLVRCVMDEVFGSENFCSLITFQKTAAVSSPEARTNVIGTTSDFILWYAKGIEHVKYRQIYLEKDVGLGAGAAYRSVLLNDANIRPIRPDEFANPDLLPSGARVFQATSLQSPGFSESLSRPFKFQGRNFTPASNSHWKTTLDGIAKLAAAKRVIVSGTTIRYVRFVDDFAVSPLTNVWNDVMGSPDVIYVVQTNPRVIERCLLMTTDPGDLVLDPTCGSGTTAYVAEQWGRRWITCDTSRVALALARTRLMAAKYPYYLLADSPDGIKKEFEISGRKPPEHKTEEDIRKGFVYKRVPHVTLKSIANNPDIREGMTRQEIDAAIAKHAETETLFDQPYEDNKRIRVCGPFSVESLSPHRTISVEEKKQRSEVGHKGLNLKMKVIGPDNFGTMILDNLRKAGVQNTRKGRAPEIRNARTLCRRMDSRAGDLPGKRWHAETRGHLHWTRAWHGRRVADSGGGQGGGPRGRLRSAHRVRLRL